MDDIRAVHLPDIKNGVGLAFQCFKGKDTVPADTLDHIADIKPRLKESVDKLMDLLLPGGRLILSIPALEEMGKETAPLPPSPLQMKDFDFLKKINHDRNCPRWWHLFYIDKV